MMTDDLYQDALLEEYRHPQNVGELKDATAVISETNASCGDTIKVFIKLENSQKIEKITWQGSGCAISQAAMSLLSVAAQGQDPSTIKTWGQAELEQMLHLNQINPGRVKCLLLGLVALQKALKMVENTA